MLILYFIWKKINLSAGIGKLLIDKKWQIKQK